MMCSKEPMMTRYRIVDETRRDFFRYVAGGTAMLAFAASPLAVRAQTAGAAPLKIATIGAGHIGSSLGTLWVKAGHPVMFSSRHPEQLKDLVAGLGPLAHAGTPAEAIAFADVVLLAVPYAAEKQIGQDFGPALATKVLVFDASNPIVPRDGEIGTWARDKGAALATAELLPGVHLVRAFNAIHYTDLLDKTLSPPGHFGVPMAGDDARAIAVASTLAREAGFEPVLIGPLAMGKYLIPGTPLAGKHTPDEIRQIVAGLK
jgi:predicted dinucleotide-binding enzyme